MNICYIENGSIDNILYVLRPEVTEEIHKRFVAEFEASPGGEYEKLVYRIANLIFFCGEDLTKTYEMFFCEEYSSFSEFLEIEQGFDEALVKCILEKCKEDENLWRIDVADYETYNFMNLFDSKTWNEESLIERINLAIARCENENR